MCIMERRKRSWPARERPIGEEKANRHSPEFRNGTKLLKTKTPRNSNSHSKHVFPFTVRLPRPPESGEASASGRALRRGIRNAHCALSGRLRLVAVRHPLCEEVDARLRPRTFPSWRRGRHYHATDSA